MYSNILMKTGLYEFQSEQQKILHTFRYFSWFFTSIFYFFGNPPSHWIFKLMVIILLFISATIITANSKNKDSHTTGSKLFVLIETVGIILILLPTGGLMSPFIWYALNPVLISVGFSSPYFCWINLVGFLSTSIIVSFLYFNNDAAGLLTFISTHSHLILIFILITLAVQLMTKLTNKLKAQRMETVQINDQLNQANVRIKATMEHMMSLYQVVEALASQHNKRNIYPTFLEYTAKLTGSELAFYWLEPSESDAELYVTGAIPRDIKRDLMNRLGAVWKDNMLSDQTFSVNINEYDFMVVVVKSLSKYYGMIGIRTNNIKSEFVEYGKQLEFVSELSAIILERFHLEEITEGLLIVEEQNRIANEMHDSVTQRLFGISCTVHEVMANWERMKSSQLQEKLLLLQESSHLAMKELRSTIYRLSSRMGGKQSFYEDTISYLDNVSKLHNIVTRLEFTGDEQLLGVSEKRGLYRIICEATGNAIRHGDCDLVTVNLTIGNVHTELKIADNGKGFSVTDDNNSSNKNYGLGLQNMERIVNLFEGDFDIHSELGSSTVIQVSIPNMNRTLNREGALQL